jgi:hypothetical protein
MKENRVRRCPKCGGLLHLSNGTWQHEDKNKCNYERQVFVKLQPNMLFLTVEAKDEKTKKFLEDIMQESPKRNIFKEIKDNGVVFIKERLPDGSVKVLDVTTVGRLCEQLAKEIREQ